MIFKQVIYLSFFVLISSSFAMQKNLMPLNPHIKVEKIKCIFKDKNSEGESYYIFAPDPDGGYIHVGNYTSGRIIRLHITRTGWMNIVEDFWFDKLKKMYEDITNFPSIERKIGYIY